MFLESDTYYFVWHHGLSANARTAAPTYVEHITATISLIFLFFCIQHIHYRQFKDLTLTCFFSYSLPNSWELLCLCKIPARILLYGLKTGSFVNSVVHFSYVNVLFTAMVIPDLPTNGNPFYGVSPYVCPSVWLPWARIIRPSTRLGQCRLRIARLPQPVTSPYFVWNMWYDMPWPPRVSRIHKIYQKVVFISEQCAWDPRIYQSTWRANDSWMGIGEDAELTGK